MIIHVIADDNYGDHGIVELDNGYIGTFIYTVRINLNRNMMNDAEMENQAIIFMYTFIM